MFLDLQSGGCHVSRNFKLHSMSENLYDFGGIEFDKVTEEKLITLQISHCMKSHIVFPVFRYIL